MPVAALPVCIFFPILLHNLLSDGAVPGGGPSAFLPRGMIYTSFRRPAGITFQRSGHSGICPGHVCPGPAGQILQQLMLQDANLLAGTDAFDLAGTN